MSSTLIGFYETRLLIKTSFHNTQSNKIRSEIRLYIFISFINPTLHLWGIGVGTMMQLLLLATRLTDKAVTRPVYINHIQGCIL